MVHFAIARFRVTASSRPSNYGNPGNLALPPPKPRCPVAKRRFLSCSSLVPSGEVFRDRFDERRHRKHHSLRDFEQAHHLRPRKAGLEQRKVGQIRVTVVVEV
jgi:hypothetical protein